LGKVAGLLDRREVRLAGHGGYSTAAAGDGDENRFGMAMRTDSLKACKVWEDGGKGSG
jgi:hypothetical protein